MPIYNLTVLANQEELPNRDGLYPVYLEVNHEHYRLFNVSDLGSAGGVSFEGREAVELLKLLIKAHPLDALGGL